MVTARPHPGTMIPERCGRLPAVTPGARKRSGSRVEDGLASNTGGARPGRRVFGCYASGTGGAEPRSGNLERERWHGCCPVAAPRSTVRASHRSVDFANRTAPRGTPRGTWPAIPGACSRCRRPARPRRRGGSPDREGSGLGQAHRSRRAERYGMVCLTPGRPNIRPD